MEDSYQFFDRMVIGEKNTLTFNFSAGLVGAILVGVPVVTVSVFDGTDPSPSSILNGSAALDSTATLALVPVAPTAVSDIQYLISVACATSISTLKLILRGILTVTQ